MSQNSQRRQRVEGFFRKYPDRTFSVTDIRNHFTDINHPLIGYYLKALTDNKTIKREGYAAYRLSPQSQTVEEKRAIVNAHLATNGSPVVGGPAWKPGDDPLVAGQNPHLAAYLGRTFGAAILERMKLTGFVAAEIAFFSQTLARCYPLSEQQKNTIERRENGATSLSEVTT